MTEVDQENAEGPSPSPSRTLSPSPSHSPSRTLSRRASRSASEHSRKPKKRIRPPEPARPAKVALLVWKIVCCILSRAARRTQRKGLQEALQRLAAQNLVKKVLATVAQWERHAMKFCQWRGEGDTKPTGTNLQLGVGWWELPELENYPVSVADATAAMLHAIQFGGSKEYGGAVGDLSSFVKEYVASCRLTCAIKRYTFEEKKARLQHREDLRQAFGEQEDARANFDERAKVIASSLVKKHAELKTFDALHSLASARTKNFDINMNNSKTICDGFLALQNVHMYQALGRIYPRLLALEKELEDTIQSVTEVTNPGADPEPIEEEDSKPKEEDSPRKRAQRRKETMRRRKALLESQRVQTRPGEETEKATNRPALKFEDKEAHDKQLALLKDKFDKVLLEYDLVPDAERGRMAHLYTLVNQGQQKLDSCQDELKKAEEDSEVFAHKLREKLRMEAEKQCMQTLRSGRLPTEMLGSLNKQKQDGPTVEDRDKLKSQNAALWMSIQDRQKITADEQDLQEELDSLVEEVKAQETAQVAEETKEAERSKELAAELPSVEPVIPSINASIEICHRAMDLASIEFVQLTTSATKLERKAEALTGSIKNLSEGKGSEQIKAQVNEWKALCKDLLLDMEQVGDSIKVDGLPKGISDKVWMQKQAEIRAGTARKKQEKQEEVPTSGEDKPKEKLSKKAQKQNAVNAKKQEMKIEKEIQDSAMRKKQVMLGIEMLWSQLPESEMAVDAPASNGSSQVSSPAVGGSGRPRPTLQTQKSRGQMNQVSPLERILQHHRVDIAAGHDRRNSLIKQIEELQQKLAELSPEQVAVLKKAEEGIAERKAAEAARRVLSSPTGTLSSRSKSKPGGLTSKFRASILRTGGTEAEDEDEDDVALSEDSDDGEAIEPMQLDPWMLAFPTDDPELGKRKWDFCKANRIKPPRLHDITRHKKYIFALRRMMKQCKRTLALKQKLLLKFLSGDELQRAKVQMQKSPQELEAEADNEGRKLKERQAMLAKLLTFWHRRMQQLEDEREAEREAFRFKVRALLEDIHGLAQVLEDAALMKKRRRRVDADDLLTLRQQKAAAAAAEAMKPRKSRAGQAGDGIANFRDMMSQRQGGQTQQEGANGKHFEDKKERKRLAELLRKHLAQHRKSFEEIEQKAEESDHSSSGSGSKSSDGIELAQAGRDGGQAGLERRKSKGDLGNSGAASEGFLLLRRRKHSLQEVPVQTLTAKTLQSLPIFAQAGIQQSEPARHRSSVAAGATRTFGRQSRLRGTAKRKSSVARKDSIFENPAAMSRRLTDDSARSAALAQVMQMAALSSSDGTQPSEQVETMRRKSEEAAALRAKIEAAGAPGETWQTLPRKSLLAPADLPGGMGHPQMRKSSLRPGPRSKKEEQYPEGTLSSLVLGPSRPSSRSGAESPDPSGPPSMGASRPPSAARSRGGPSRVYSGRPSTAGLSLLMPGAPDGGAGLDRKGRKSPADAKSRRSKSPDSRRDSGASEHDDERNQVSDEEMRADLFLKATYLHLGAFRQHYLHPSLKSQRPSLSDAILGENGEVLFRSLISQILDLPPELLRRATRHFINTERARCLFIVKNSLIHQARVELEASQRTISILESDLSEIERQLKEGGPMFPPLASSKPKDTSQPKEGRESKENSDSSSDSSDDEDEPVVESKSTVGRPPSAQQATQRLIRSNVRRPAVHSFLAFAEGLHQISQRHTRDHTLPRHSDESDAPLLQIRSVDTNKVTSQVSDAAAVGEAQDHLRRGASKVWKSPSVTSQVSLAERLREAQLQADAVASSRQSSNHAADKPLLSAASLQTSMLKTMLKKVGVKQKQSTTMSLIGDYNWDKTLKKFDTLLKKFGLQNRDIHQGHWQSHFAYDLGPEGPLSSRLPDSEGRPSSAPGCRPIKHRPPAVKEEVEKKDESPANGTPGKSPSIQPSGEEAEQPAAEAEKGEKKKNTPLLLSLARFMTKVKAKKSQREKLHEFYYLEERKAKWSKRSSKPQLLTAEMEEEWDELRDKVRMEKGQWYQHSRRKVEAMLQEEEFAENWDRQQRNLQRERHHGQNERIFDTLSFVRWKVNKQLRQAMQDVEKGNKVNLPRKQDRSAGPPPPDPVWIVGDKEGSGLDKARERIASLRAKKYRGKPFMASGQGRGWRVDQDLFDHVDELYQQRGSVLSQVDEASRAASEMPVTTDKVHRELDSDSESERSHSSASLQRRVVSAPAGIRRVQARRITRSRAKSRELSVLPPWMRQMLMQDDVWQQMPESSPWDRTCWLQPVRVKGRTATDRAMTPEQVAKALSRKSPRGGKPRRVVEDPVLFVRKACRELVEEYAASEVKESAPEEGKEKKEEFKRPNSPLSLDAEARHNRVMEILEQDSLLTQEPLERVVEEPDEDDSGTGSITLSTFAEGAGAQTHAEGELPPEGSTSAKRFVQEIYTIKARPIERKPPALSTQMLVFEMPVAETAATKGRRGEANHQMHSDASTESLSSQGKGKATRRQRGLAGVPRTHRQRVERPKARRRKHSEMDVVARKMVDLSFLTQMDGDHRRRSSVKQMIPPAVETVEVQAEVEKPKQPAPPQITVNIGKLSAILAKQWSEVTAEEVETRRLGMQKLKAAKAAPKATFGDEVDVIAVESLYEGSHMAATASHEETRQSSKASALSDISERKVSKTNSLGSARTPAGSRLNSKGASAGGPGQNLPMVDADRQVEDMAPVALETHLTQWRSWRREGRLPSASVQLPPAPAVELRSHPTPAAKNSGPSPARPGQRADSPALPSRSVKEYLTGFRDRDLDGLLEAISQTPADDYETNEFVWPPPNRYRDRIHSTPSAPSASKLPMVQGRGLSDQQSSSTGESWVRAFTSRADSPAWLLDALDSRASSRTSRSYGDRASPPPDGQGGRPAEDEVLPTLPSQRPVVRTLL